MKKTQDKAGITLVALVITVIVLVILAGTAISMSISEENLFERSEGAVNKYNNKVEETKNEVKKANEIIEAGFEERSILSALKEYFIGNNLDDLSVYNNGTNKIEYQNSGPINDAYKIEDTEIFGMGWYVISYNNEYYKVSYDDENNVTSLEEYGIVDIERLNLYFHEHTYGALPETFENDNLIPNANTTIEGIRRVSNNAGGTLYIKYNNKFYKINYGRDSKEVTEVTETEARGE